MTRHVVYATMKCVRTGHRLFEGVLIIGNTILCVTPLSSESNPYRIIQPEFVKLDRYYYSIRLATDKIIHHLLTLVLTGYN